MIYLTLYTQICVIDKNLAEIINENFTIINIILMNINMIAGF